MDFSVEYLIGCLAEWDIKDGKDVVPITPEVLASEKAANDYDAAVEAWGQRGWNAVGRVCLWAKGLGMQDAPC